MSCQCRDVSGVVQQQADTVDTAFLSGQVQRRHAVTVRTIHLRTSQTANISIILSTVHA